MFIVSLFFTLCFYILIELQGLVEQDGSHVDFPYRSYVKWSSYYRLCHLRRDGCYLLVWATKAVFWSVSGRRFLGGFLHHQCVHTKLASWVTMHCTLWSKLTSSLLWVLSVYWLKSSEVSDSFSCPLGKRWRLLSQTAVVIVRQY